jgi:hypothetical protein
MNRVLSVLAGGCMLAFVQALPASAAPLSPAATGSTADDAAPIVKVHGFHHRCRWGPRRGWWHRHVGYYGRPVPCRAYRYYRYHSYYPSYYGPTFVFRFGHRHRFHRHHFHRHHFRRFHRHRR